MDRKASAVWKGGLKDGKGEFSAPSGVFSHTPYSFRTRFEDAPGTNPEELIAAAHAGCFSMQLAFMLTAAGFVPTEISTEAAVSLVPDGAGFKISKSALTLRARIPGISQDQFLQIAHAAETGCPVSKVLNAEITLAAVLAE